MIPFGEQKTNIDEEIDKKLYAINKVAKMKVLETTAKLYGDFYKDLIKQGFSNSQSMQILLQVEIGK